MGGALKRPFSEMPTIDNISEDFLVTYRAKIQKVFSNIEPNTNSIPVSKVTKNHLYSQIGNKCSSENARTFLVALEKHGLGKLSCDKKEFHVTEKENIISPEK